MGQTRQAPAASIVVTTANDELNSDSDCSLREAIQAATTNAAVDDCAAGGSGVDTINFDAGLNGETIVLDSVLTIASSLTRDGSGRGLTVRGDEATRLFQINSGQVSLIALTLTQGAATSAGGGLYTNGGPQTLREKPSIR